MGHNDNTSFYMIVISIHFISDKGFYCCNIKNTIPS